MKLRFSWQVTIAFLLIVYVAILYLSGEFLKFTKISDDLARDIDQDYLMARAVIEGINPYNTIPYLGETLLRREFEWFMLPHPSPHPPTSILWFIPLAAFPLELASRVWFVFSILCSFFCSLLLYQSFVDSKFQSALTFFSFWSLILVSQASLSLLYFGQMGFVLLLLCLLSWRELQKAHDFGAGAFFGLAFTLKFFMWPVLVLFIVRKRFKFFLGFAATLLPSALISLLLIGNQGYVDYFTKALPAALDFWKYAIHNRSLLHLFSSLLSGDRMYIDEQGHTYPIYTSLAETDLLLALQLIGWALVLVVVFIVFREIINRKNDVDSDFWKLIGLSLLISPLVWDHYYVLLLPIVLSSIWFSSEGFTIRLATLVFVLCCLYIPVGRLAGSLIETGALDYFQDPNAVPFRTGFLDPPLSILLLFKVPAVAATVLVLSFGSCDEEKLDVEDR